MARRPTAIVAVTCALAAAAAAVRAGDPPTGTWEVVGHLPEGRYALAAIRLRGGRVLLAGGYSFEADRTHATTLLFDPRDRRLAPGPALAVDRNFAVPVVLPGGDHLLIAGFCRGSGTTAAVEWIGARARRHRLQANLREPRELFTATRLPDGRILVTGGYDTHRRQTLATAELYDPATGRSEPLPPLRHRRFGHDAVLLPDGRVLIAGGKAIPGEIVTDEVELFDPARREFRLARGRLPEGRDRLTLTPIRRGRRILVAGGLNPAVPPDRLRRCFWFDPATETFAPGPELAVGRMAHVATPLPDGSILFTGGWNAALRRTVWEAERYDPRRDAMLSAGRMAVGRHDHVAIPVRGGVLVAGGKRAEGNRGDSPTEIEWYTPPGASCEPPRAGPFAPGVKGSHPENYDVE